MKRVNYILTIFITILIPLNIYSQWILQNSGTTQGLQDCDFINQNTGWICSVNGQILKTTNGGNTWQQQTSGVTKILNGIDAVDENLIWCVGQWNTILKSTNGGINWLTIRDGTLNTTTFLKVYFLNVNTGWMLKANYILRTTNGGATFDSTNTVFTFLWDIYFKDAMTGVLCADGARIMKSTDGGVIWNLIPVPLYQGGQPNFYRLSFVNDTYGWTIGEGSNFGLGKLVYRTTDFGTSWDTIARVPYPNNELNYSVFFTSLNIGFCGGTSGYTYKTTNGGFNWVQQTIPSNGYRNDFYFIDDTLGWSIGGGGQIFKTINGGNYVGILPISNTNTKEFFLYQNYPNPFNPETYIEFEIMHNDDYLLELFDVLGKKIRNLVKDKFEAGKYRYAFNGSELSAGVYFYKLSSKNYTATKKLILIK